MDMPLVRIPPNTPEQVGMWLEQGFRIIITAPERTTSGLAEGRRLTNR
jgi:hypothetical protein